MKATIPDTVVYRIVEENVFIVNKEGEFFIIDDPVGFTIFKSIDSGENIVEEIVKKILDEFDVTSETANSDTIKFLKKLEDKGIIKLSEE